MPLKLSLILFFHFFWASQTLAYLSYGDGSDTCNWTVDTVLTKAIWNCDSLNIGTNINITVSNTVTTPIQIRVQGTSFIAGDIVVSASASKPGPGGSSGGSCTPAAICTLQNGSGSTGGEGQGGQRGTGAGGLAGNGGGGGGAGFGAAGSDGSNGTAGGGTPGNLGSGGASFTTLAAISSSLIGGVGGGAGGSGDDGLGTIGSGGNGGHGSGSIAIISKGDITFTADASISATGVSGTDGGSAGGVVGGNGGAGSGGVIYIVTKESLTATAGVTIDISGGAANTTAGRAAGGAASDGLFRVDTGDGSFTGTFGATPPGLTGTTPAGINDPSVSSQLNFESDIAATCSYRVTFDLKHKKVFLMTFLLGLIIALFVSGLLKSDKLRR